VRNETFIKIGASKPEEGDYLGNGHTWEDDIKMHVKGILREGVD
jgi:hypothetical protein